MKKIEIIAIVVILVVLLFIILTNLKQKKRNNHFLITNCKKGKCYDSLQKCAAMNGYTYDGSSDDKRIERKTFKCILDMQDKYKLLKLDNIFVPSMMDGTFCDILYTTYYDFSDLTVLKNRMYNLNMPLYKCIRIRKYHFNPKTYFEIKYTGGTKIRALIDDQLNLLEEQTIDEEYKDLIVSILDKIKQNKIKPIFNNTYKRLSFIYKNNPNIRMTIDTNIEFFQNHFYKVLDKDILEMKIPNSISVGEAEQYLKEINHLIGTQLTFTHFSKFEYYYYKVMINQ